jgi:uncharacterized membrane protein YfcA
VDPIWLGLAVVFFLIALLYACVGFGGGSSYTAMMALFGVTISWIPILSLSCNIIVVLGGCWHFWRQGYMNFRLITPFLVTSIVAAYFAGRVPVDPGVYILILAASLLLAASVLLLRPKENDEHARSCPLSAALIIGLCLGGLSGLVGIGGGIFLAPILLLARWASPKESAAAASAFILLNSLAGLVGQVSKPGAIEAFSVLPLLAVAVFIGGQIGSHLGSVRLQALRVRQATACLIALVSIRLFLQSL